MLTKLIMIIRKDKLIFKHKGLVNNFIYPVFTVSLTLTPALSIALWEFVKLSMDSFFIIRQQKQKLTSHDLY